MTQDDWAFGLQVAGAVLVLLGLGFTWAMSSESFLAKWFRGWWKPLRAWYIGVLWEPFRAWCLRVWARMRGRTPEDLHGEVISGMSTSWGVGAASGLAGPGPDADLGERVAYLDRRVGQLEQALAASRAETAAGLASIRDDLSRGLEAARAHVETAAAATSLEIRKANLSGLGLAAWGGVLTFLGLLMSGSPT